MSESKELPGCLAQLTWSQKDQIQTTLANDEASTDAEMVDFWVTECGIPNNAAAEAVKYRTEFFKDPMFELFDLYSTDATAPSVGPS